MTNSNQEWQRCEDELHASRVQCDAWRQRHSMLSRQRDALRRERNALRAWIEQAEHDSSCKLFARTRDIQIQYLAGSRLRPMVHQSCARAGNAKR